MRAIVAGYDGENAVERACLGDVEPLDLAMADRTAEDAPDQRIGMIEVRGVARASGDLLDAVDQRDPAAQRAGLHLYVGAHDGASATARTASMILT
jgi:hypothetical protein